jgi:hypothetical protein
MRNQIVKYRKILINVSRGSKKDERRYANKVFEENIRFRREIQGNTKLYSEKEEKEILSV